MELAKEIVEYWEEQPPHVVQKGVQVGTLQWSKQITENRHKIVPYLKSFLQASAYEGKKVLDLGCGAGSDMLEFIKAGAADVQGIDITQKAVNMSNSRLAVEDLSDRGVATRYNGYHIPFQDETFDLVYSGGVLHHTPYMDDLLAEARRVLKPEGRLKLMVYNKWSILYYYSILYKNRIAGSKESREALLSKYSEYRTGCPYTRAFSNPELTAKLMEFGFSTESDRTRDKGRVWSDYAVYDEDNESRKLTANTVFDVEKTGINDIDCFMTAYNYDVEHSYDESFDQKYGWHLLADVLKRQ